MRNSTIVIIILLVVVAIGFFFLGSQYGSFGSSAATTTVSVTQNPGTTGGDTNPPPTTGDADWQTYSNTVFSIRYPSVFTVNPISGTDEWRNGANGDAGTLDFSLMLPKSYEPNTNFDDAKLTVGYSANATSVSDCLTPDASGAPNATVSTKVINGVSYTVFTSNDAGAGNRYDTTSYRTVHNNTCVAVEYTIHYSAIENFPAGSVSQFDENKVQTLLDSVVNTVVLK